ncbi:MAG TPA: STAS domain-containing protein [Solirubrobacteraceae bacterium]|nr:STAS domain-containing protein [Solirubrobacteraceae bacterium]
MDALTVERGRDGATTVLAASGEVDVEGGGELRAAMEQAARERARAVELDLRGVTFLDSSGLSAVLHGARTLDAQGTALATRCPHGSEARLVIEMAGVGRILGLQD